MTIQTKSGDINDVFHVKKIVLSIIFAAFRKFSCQPSKPSMLFNFGNEQQIISIIRLSKPTSLRLISDTRDPSTSTDVSSFIQLCKTIKGLLFYYFFENYLFLESTTLKKINLRVYRYDSVLARILFDLLPDNIVEFYGFVRNLRHLKHRQSIMDRVEIEKEDNSQVTGNFLKYFYYIMSYLDYAMIFKIKARSMYLTFPDALMKLSRFDK
jgi:hypothetical protein